MVGILGWRTALCVGILCSFAATQDKEFPLPNVDNDPEVQLAQDKISEWTNHRQRQVNEWHATEKARLQKLQDAELAQFEARVRAMKCDEMKSQLAQKLVGTTKRARVLSSKRNAEAAKAQAIAKAKEILTKVSEPQEEDEEQLAEALGDQKPRDGNAWLSAIESADPAWQHKEEEKMRSRMRTDPNWRAKMDNVQGDGGRSWRQHVTYLDNAPPLTNPPSALALIQTDQGLESQEPLLKEADVLAIENLGGKHPKPLQQAEQLIWDQRTRNKPFREGLMMKHKKWAATQHEELQKMKGEQAQDIGMIKAERSKIVRCGQLRATMSKAILDVIVGLPVSEQEKEEAEKPLLADMEDWLQCETCEKPVAGAVVS